MQEINEKQMEDLLNEAELEEVINEDAETVEESKKTEEKTPKVDVDHEEEDEDDGGAKDKDSSKADDDDEDVYEKKSVKEDADNISDDDDEDAEDEDDSIEEDIQKLCDETEGLTEEFKEKSKIIFEAAFTSKLREATEKLESEYEMRLSEEVATVRGALCEKIDGFLDEAVENWIEENEVALESGLHSELTSEFMEALKAVFTEHYIEIPEAKVDIFKEVEEEAMNLEGKLKESVGEVADLKKQVETLSREKVLAEASKDLATTQAVKLASLVEDVEFVDAETFAKKVEVIKESFFSENSDKEGAEETKKNEEILETKEIVEGGDEDPDQDVSDPMKRYLSGFKRLNKTV